jgi:hypothetical protein
MGIFAQAVPFTNQTRLIFESALPLLPHRRHLPKFLSQDRSKPSSPHVPNQEKGQNDPSNLNKVVIKD